MFCPKWEMPNKWEISWNFYLEGKLTGIETISSSSDSKSGVIVFECGPASKDKKIMEHGRNLLAHIPYYSQFGFMYYKTDEQSEAGTRETRATENWLYRIRVPNLPAVLNFKRNPSQVSEVSWLCCIDPNIEKNFDIHRLNNGNWLMFFPNGHLLDQKWAQAVTYYRQGKLPGISSIKVSTAGKNPSGGGVIMFACGPAIDEDAVMRYGKKLLHHISYTNSNGGFYYKAEDESANGDAGTNSRYRIDVELYSPEESDQDLNEYAVIDSSK